MREQHGMTLLGSTLAKTGSINPGTGRRGLQLPSVLHKLKHPRSQGAALTPVSFLSIPFPGSLAVSTVPTCVPSPPPSVAAWACFVFCSCWRFPG